VLAYGEALTVDVSEARSRQSTLGPAAVDGGEVPFYRLGLRAYVDEALDGCNVDVVDCTEIQDYGTKCGSVVINVDLLAAAWALSTMSVVANAPLPPEKLTRIIPWSITKLSIVVQCCGAGDGLRMMHEFVHVALLVEVCEAFGKAVDQDAWVWRLNIDERVRSIFAADRNEGFACRRFRPRGKLTVLLVRNRLGRCTVDSDLSKKGTMCEQLTPQQKSKRSSNRDVDAVFDVREYSDEHTSEEDDNLKRACFPELENYVRRSDEITDGMDDNGCKSG
jgi:hypothetical protein